MASRNRGVMDESKRIGFMHPRHCGADWLSERQSRSAGNNHYAAILYGDVESLYSLLKYGKLGIPHGGHPASKARHQPNAARRNPRALLPDTIVRLSFTRAACGRPTRDDGILYFENRRNGGRKWLERSCHYPIPIGHQRLFRTCVRVLPRTSEYRAHASSSAHGQSSGRSMSRPHLIRMPWDEIMTKGQGTVYAHHGSTLI